MDVETVQKDDRTNEKNEGDVGCPCSQGGNEETTTSPKVECGCSGSNDSGGMDVETVQKDDKKIDSSTVLPISSHTVSHMVVVTKHGPSSAVPAAGAASTSDEVDVGCPCSEGRNEETTESPKVECGCAGSNDSGGIGGETVEKDGKNQDEGDGKSPCSEGGNEATTQSPKVECGGSGSNDSGALGEESVQQNDMQEFQPSTNQVKSDWDNVQEEVGNALSDSNSVDFDSLYASSAELESRLESASLEQTVGAEDDHQPFLRTNGLTILPGGGRRRRKHKRKVKIDWDKSDELEDPVALWSPSKSDDLSSEVALSDSNDVDFDFFYSDPLERNSDSLEEAVGTESNNPSSASIAVVHLNGGGEKCPCSEGGDELKLDLLKLTCGCSESKDSGGMSGESVQNNGMQQPQPSTNEADEDAHHEHAQEDHHVHADIACKSLADCKGRSFCNFDDEHIGFCETCELIDNDCKNAILINQRSKDACCKVCEAAHNDADEDDEDNTEAAHDEDDEDNTVHEDHHADDHESPHHIHHNHHFHHNHDSHDEITILNIGTHA